MNTSIHTFIVAVTGRRGLTTRYPFVGTIKQAKSFGKKKNRRGTIRVY